MLITELIGFAVTLKNHLRGEKTVPEELGRRMPLELIHSANQSACPPLAMLQMASSTVLSGLKTEGNNAAVVNASYQVLTSELSAISGTVGACERIKNTPTPYGYVASLRVFLLLWLFTLPFCLIGTYSWEAIPGIGLIAFLFLNLEQMAMEIEQPFGDDPDDLPLEEYCMGIERILSDLHRRATIKA